MSTEAEGRVCSRCGQPVKTIMVDGQARDWHDQSGRVLSRECRACGTPLTDLDGLTCSPACAEKWRATVLSMPAGCERSGECALPFGHDGDCDWGA